MPNLIFKYYDLHLLYPVLKEKVYAAGAVLIIAVLIMNALSKIISYHYGRMMKN